ncbi:MAG TPA: enolase C-terminal domain-like protein [Rhodanobacteraceae bacterium]|nr:enolase C-terminal domain-like protein [Rhodanobacteraceae bacterium]
MSKPAPAIDRVEATAYRIPTDSPEADGTIAWDSTTIVIAQVHAGGIVGIGYTYGHAAIAALIDSPLRDCLMEHDPEDIPGAWKRMNRALRNMGRPGAGLMAIAALDHALWDLKARLHEISVVDLMGAARLSVPVYGSGGFTSYSVERLQEQLAGWVADGLYMVKMKVGTYPDADAARVHAAREAIGADASLMVDANGAYTPRQALAQAMHFADDGVCWYEEPVSSDDLEHLAWLRARLPATMQLTAGEYGWDDWYFRRMLAAGAVDVLQVDSTRCGGFTGFLRAAALAHAHGVPVSAHCAPALHAHVCAALGNVSSIEYFHDHTRIESMCFDGLPELHAGALVVDRNRHGLGLQLKAADMAAYEVGGHVG